MTRRQRKFEKELTDLLKRYKAGIFASTRKSLTQPGQLTIYLPVPTKKHPDAVACLCYARSFIGVDFNRPPADLKRDSTHFNPA